MRKIAPLTTKQIRAERDRKATQLEKTFRGPIHEQIRESLRYIENNVVREKVIKHPGRAEATRFFSYPMTAIKEALVNAMYHRGYDQREPVEVRINPDGIDIISYPGPDPSIAMCEYSFVEKPFLDQLAALKSSPQFIVQANNIFV